MIGLDTCLAILEVLHKEMGDPKYRPCPLLRKMVSAGSLGRKREKGFTNMLEGQLAQIRYPKVSIGGVSDLVPNSSFAAPKICGFK